MQAGVDELALTQQRACVARLVHALRTRQIHEMYFGFSDHIGPNLGRREKDREDAFESLDLV